MIRLLTVIGARPQIIKAAAISRAVNTHFSEVVEERILHTGQHYDTNMSQVFFDELCIPQPDFNLGVGSGTHGEQTAKMIAGIEAVLTSEHFDGIVLYGDTNSTLAGAIAASKIGVPVFHVEAGLRSFNMAMPEEVNRIVCDWLSSICFCPTRTAVDNLEREGFFSSPAVFKNGKSRMVVHSGDVMYDNSMWFAPMAEQKSDVLSRVDVQPGGFILATIHRPYNTDNPVRLSAIISSLITITERDGVELVFPLHPRTKKSIDKYLPKDVYDQLMTSARVKIIPPASFYDIIVLEKNARVVMTDSGGVQKESFFFERPCVILRPETEWVEIVDHGAGVVADADSARIINAYYDLVGTTPTFPPLFGDAQAAKHISDTIIEYIDSLN